MTSDNGTGDSLDGVEARQRDFRWTEEVAASEDNCEEHKAY